MLRHGRIVADILHVREQPWVREDRRSIDTTAACDRAILELWDCGMVAEDIAIELGMSEYLVEQAIAQFDGGAA